ncbi:MAG: hypothetical protein J5935_00770 [Lachnospiraceae bacterium]|nr:hypothetical protein [Lachnospiraceae bacterium]
MSTKNRELYESWPEWKAVLTLALPSVLVQIVMVIYNMTDTFFIGLAGSDAMTSAVTVCMPAFLFLTAIANLFGIGAAGAVSRSLGKDKSRRAKNISRFGFWGSLALGGAYVLFAFFFRHIFVDLLGGRAPEVHPLALEYILITVVIAGVPTVLNNYLAHLIRAEGRSGLASVGLAAGGILNMILDPLFMFVILTPGHEVAGAAIATGLSNVLTLVYYIVLILHLRTKGETLFSFHLRREMFGDFVPREVIRTGLPACVMTLFENISYAVLENIILGAGVAAQAGLGVAKKINMLAHSMVRGVSQGVLSLIGYTYAEGARIRMKKVVRITATLSVAISAVCMTVFLLFGAQLSGLFLRSGETTLNYATRFLHILCIGAPFSALAYTVISFFQATNRSQYSFLLAILRKGVLDIPLMFLLASAARHTGAVWATPIADVICCAAAVIMLVLWLKAHARKNKFSPRLSL